MDGHGNPGGSCYHRARKEKTSFHMVYLEPIIITIIFQNITRVYQPTKKTVVAITIFGLI